MSIVETPSDLLLRVFFDDLAALLRLFVFFLFESVGAAVFVRLLHKRLSQEVFLRKLDYFTVWTSEDVRVSELA